MKFPDYPQIVTLASLLRSQIGLAPINTDLTIDESLVDFAIDRHRVGSLLYKASQNPYSISLAAQDKLLSEYNSQVSYHISQMALMKKISQLFSNNAIPFSFLKGQGLAEQLYNEPHTRYSKDIDILIPPDLTKKAISLIKKNEYIPLSPNIRNKKTLTTNQLAWNMKHYKDITITDPQLQLHFELHQRLFEIETFEFTTRFNQQINFRTTPSIDQPLYVLYLIIHGATALFERMKWVVDISLLIRHVSFEVKQDIFKLSKKIKLEHILVASLKLTEEIFPGSLDDEFKALLDSCDNNNHSEKLLATFRQTLMSTSEADPQLSLEKPRYFDRYLALYGHRTSLHKLVQSRIVLPILRRI